MATIENLLETLNHIQWLSLIVMLYSMGNWCQHNPSITRLPITHSSNTRKKLSSNVRTLHVSIVLRLCMLPSYASGIMTKERSGDSGAEERQNTLSTHVTKTNLRYQHKQREIDIYFFWHKQPHDKSSYHSLLFFLFSRSSWCIYVMLLTCDAMEQKANERRWTEWGKRNILDSDENKSERSDI